MAKKKKSEAPKEVKEIEEKVAKVCDGYYTIPVEWSNLKATQEVKIEMDGKVYVVSVDVARVLCKKGKAKQAK